jgi:putative ABC transport system substrate-binding protein
MKRREFLGLAAGLAGLPLAARAQTRVARVGLLLLGRSVAAKELPLTAELARLGFVEGRNVVYDIRGADGDISQLPRLARELAAAKPDVMIGSSSAMANALVSASSEIPIVMTLIGDPIALGLSNSISRPNRNVTGSTLASSTLAGKRLELLRELIPNLRKVAYVSAQGPMLDTFGQEVRIAADSLGITLVSIPIITEASVAEGFSRLDQEQVQAVLVETNPTSVQLSGHIVNESLVRDLPSMHAWYFEVQAGALMSYGPALLQDHAFVARYVDRILKGAKVSELPFEEPTQIKLTINLRTARALKIAIPPTLLVRADDVIE